METSYWMNVLVLLTVVAAAQCYRNGARGDSCVDMKPGHGQVQNTTSPYVLELEGSKTTYSADKEVRGKYSLATAVTLCCEVGSSVWLLYSIASSVLACSTLYIHASGSSVDISRHCCKMATHRENANAPYLVVFGGQWEDSNSSNTGVI